MKTSSALARPVYDAFSRYRLNGPVEGCPCCVAQDSGQALFATPLRELSADDLNHYAFKAMTTWGTTHDFKHFLPRILELLATRSLLVDHELVARKLAYAGWGDWPTCERKAILDFVDAMWDIAIAENDLRAILDWTEFRNIVGEDYATQGLEKLLRESSLELVAHFICASPGPLPKHFGQPTLRDALLSAAVSATNKKDNQLAEAYDTLTYQFTDQN